ncbi:sulfite exporter TauE/SafE family protein [Caenispirillum bisanense]|uniref:sulfite exporter TauE/SafE family protein n=1 Tax=Caenispirillum bisanense TaxID=414052 RepID=UPI0031E010E3
MDIYLPVANMTENVLVLFGVGWLVGVLSGMFGVGGGFLLTPLLIFLGIPPTVAVGTGANQVVGASVSGVLAHWRRGNVDVKMGLVLLAGGVAGSSLGVWLFAILRRLGQVETVVQILYVIMLGIIGGLMLYESLQQMRRRRGGRRPPARKVHRHAWGQNMPLKVRFRRSRLYISVIPPLAIGAFVGVLSAIMGVGGGFIMVPAMIYLLEMPTAVVVGTSLFQIIFVAANVTWLQASANQAVDAVLAVILLAGGVVGAQMGARFGYKLNAEQMRSLLALIVLSVAGKLLYDLVSRPDELYSLGLPPVL